MDTRYSVPSPDSPKVNHDQKQSDTQTGQIILLQKNQLPEQKAKIAIKTQEQKHLERIYLLETELAAKNQEISEIHRKIISGQVKLVEDKETQYYSEDNLKDEKIKRYKTELRLHMDANRDLTTEVKNLKQQLNVLTNESKEIHVTLAEQKSFLELQGQVIKGGQREVFELEAEIAKKNATIEELRIDLRRTERDRDQLQNSIKKLQRSSDKKSLTVKVLEESCKKAAMTDCQALNYKRMEIVNLKMQLKECEFDKLTIKELENRLGDQSQLLQLQENRLEQKERTIEELTGEVDSIKETYETVLKHIKEANLLKKSHNSPNSSCLESTHKRKKGKKKKKKKDKESKWKSKHRSLSELVTNQSAEIAELKNRCNYYKQSSKDLQNNLSETSSLLKTKIQQLQENERRLSNLEHELEIAQISTEALSTNLKSVKTERDHCLKFVEEVKVIADWKGSESESPVLQLNPLIEHLKSLKFGATQVRSVSTAKKISRLRLRQLRKSVIMKKKVSKWSLVASSKDADIEGRNIAQESYSHEKSLDVEPQPTSSTNSQNSISQDIGIDSFSHANKMETGDNEVEPIQPTSTFQAVTSTEEEFVEIEALD